MKRLAVGALFFSLLAGSVAMAGQGAHIAAGNQNVDNRGGHHDGRRNHDGRRDDGKRHNWNGGRNDNRRGDWNRGNDRRDWNRDHNRRDWNRGNDRHDRKDWNRGHDRRDWNRGNDRHDWNRHRNAPRYNYSPPRHKYYPPRHGWDRARYHYGVYNRPHGYYSHRWIRGERLPRSYYSRPYVVYDYERCGLRSPPYGHHWVRVDSDVVLAAITTGVILDVAYSHFY